MKRLRLVREDDDYRYADTERIRLALVRRGYAATAYECCEAWERYSNSMCAGWMHVPDDDSEILVSVRAYFEEDDEDEDDTY